MISYIILLVEEVRWYHWYLRYFQVYCTEMVFAHSLSLQSIEAYLAQEIFKDVRANCFCASLLRTQIHTPRHACALSNKMNSDRADGHWYNFAWI